MPDLPPALRDWLATQREQLNAKFRLAQRRYPGLHAETALALVGELLPAVARWSDSAELYASLFDLVVLHAGRGLLAPTTTGDGGRSPALGVLFRDVFPMLAPLLARRPRQLPGALSNAVENLGPVGLDFARRLGDLADLFADPDVLLDAGAVLAWRLGDARLRTPALERAARLPPDLATNLLDLPGWPTDLLPVVLDALGREGWLRPEDVFSEAQRRKPNVVQLRQRLDAWDEQVGGGWTLAARLGDFVGFDGAFAEPPVLLDPGPGGSRHRFWVKCGGTTYRLDGDAYGGVCRPDHGVAFPRAAAATDAPVSLPTTTSVLVRPDLVAFTRPDSFRVRVLIRRRGL